MRLIAHIGIHTLTAIIIASLHFPLVYSYLHLFINDTHTECQEYSKTHFHKKDVECYVLHTLKPGDKVSVISNNFGLFIPEQRIERIFNRYTFLSESSSPCFLRRGPPSFS